MEHKETLSDSMPKQQPMTNSGSRADPRTCVNGLDISDLPKYVRCINGLPDARILTHAIYQIGEPDCGVAKRVNGRILCGITSGQLSPHEPGRFRWSNSYLDCYEKWEPMVGDRVMAAYRSCVITAIDYEFFHEGSNKVGVRLFDENVESWRAIHSGDIYPILGLKPDSRYWRNNPAEAEVNTPTVDNEITLAEAIVNHNAMMVGVRAERTRDRILKNESREIKKQIERTAVMDSDAGRSHAREARILALRSEIPVLEAKLLALKQEFKQLEG